MAPLAAAKNILDQMRPPKAEWSVDDIPDLSGRVILVTGGNAGIGYETTKALLNKNAKVYIACRSPEKANKAIVALREETGRAPHFLQLDLASLASIRESAKVFLEMEPKLHILFNNAGVMEPSIDLLTADGYDLTVGTNVLGPYYFTSLIIPALLAATDEGPHKARIVTTSSLSAESVSKTVQDYTIFRENDKKRRQRSVESLYNTSKWMNIVFTAELSRRYKDKGIVCTAVNPGVVQSELQRHLTGAKARIVAKLLHPTPYGALTQLYAGTSEHADEFEGGYFIPWARRGTPIPSSQDPKEGKKLWEWLEAQVRPYENQ